MFLSNASIRRPIAMLSLIVALALLGLNAYRKIGLEMMPHLDVPFITVSTVYPGASPEEIETDVAKRIEDAVVSIDGLKHVTSSCMENVCITSIELNLGEDVDITATDVREKLDMIRSEFPGGVEDPTIQKFDINSTAIVTLGLTGDATLEDLYDYADNVLSDRLTTISGVADVQLIGGAEREVRVELSREKLAARGLTTMSVVEAVGQGVRTIPAGRVRERGREYSVKFDADTEDMAALMALEVAGADGRRVHIRDVGRAFMSTEELRTAAMLDGHPAIAVKVVKKADANAVRVTRRVREVIDVIREDLPGGMELVWVTDDGTFIEAMNRDAWLNVLQGIGLTAAILLLFLHDLRSLVVVGITMPLTIVIGMFVIGAMGYSLNTSTLIAIGMSVGILVTNSIVVLESIVSRIERGEAPKEASRLGASDAFVAVLASAGTNVVVLVPLAFMPSMVGLFIEPLAMTMFVMTLASLFISFTLTPILCSRLLKARATESRSPLALFGRLWNRAFDRLVVAYGFTIRFANRHRWAGALSLVAVVLLMVQSFGLAGGLGFSLVDDVDMGRVVVKLEFPTSDDLEHTRSRVGDVEARLADVPELRHILSTVGRIDGIIGKSSRGVYLAQTELIFSNRTDRALSIDDLQDEVRARLADFPGAVVSCVVPAIIGGQSTDIELEISGDDLDRLDALALEVEEIAGAVPGIIDTDTTVRDGKPELTIRPHRPVLADLGVGVSDLGMTMRANIEGVDSGNFRRGARNYDIVVTLEERPGKDQIEAFPLPGAPGHPTSLATFARVDEGRTPILITRKDKRRVSIFYANLTPDLPLGTAAERIGESLDEKDVLPRGYEPTFAGGYEAMAEGQAAMGEAGLIALVLVILMLAAILESVRQPILILVTVPLALIGVFWALAMSGDSMSVFVTMGIVMLVGIVVNNAILIVERYNALILAGTPRHDAMIRAASERFRPVVMITLAAVLGMVPLAFGRGMGAELRNGVGIASMGGILASGVLTLLVVPILQGLVTRREKVVSD
jgi:hydrophobic/amphiphilic exporter-1 (mainly G- bacteria), HAE1 family